MLGGTDGITVGCVVAPLFAGGAPLFVDGAPSFSGVKETKGLTLALNGEVSQGSSTPLNHVFVMSKSSSGATAVEFHPSQPSVEEWHPLVCAGLSPKCH